MLKIKPSVRVLELDSACATICRLYGEASILKEDALLKKVMEQLILLSAQMSLAIKQDKVANELDEADSVRDEALKAFGKVLDGYAVFPQEEKRVAAKRVLTVYEKYRSTIVRASYGEESALIRSLLGDLAEDSVENAALILEGIPELIASIRSAQESFLLTYDIYVSTKSIKTEGATSIKKTMLKVLNEQFVPYLGAVSLINPDFYEAFASQVEFEIRRVNGF